MLGRKFHRKDQVYKMTNASKDLLHKPIVTAEIIESLEGADLNDLCDATEATREDGTGFGWVSHPTREAMERYWRGVLVVPERSLVIVRLDDVICGSIQLIEPSKHNEAQSFSASLLATFVAPWARGHGAGNILMETVENLALEKGYKVLNLDVRETQRAAINLYERLGYKKWGTSPYYAMVDNKIMAGHFYSKVIDNSTEKEQVPFIKL